MMRCERRNLTLTRPGCARLWASAQDVTPEPWEGRAACRSCPVGAANAGKTVSASSPSLEKIQPVCPRCLRVSDRIINDWLCVSCTNRGYEAAKGRNAKGTKPLICADLHDESVSVITAGTVRQILVPSMLGRVEAMVLLSKTLPVGVLFGPSRPRWLPPPLRRPWYDVQPRQMEFSL